ncbi:hypothetical protein GCK72_026136 [Caenorhabditis remanei]|uniref:Uncharacterized protein n=2 Tax=Caenorhabditis remanei TaxID=31234 RepID=A0A6A5G3U4_CAERE|nr:hypothetical protein GCK72_026136 [Caenorhabditis remanei]KAF1749668.1 hypothetical protein GCK72_026136 [Caenorhabditis remanei]
MSITTSIFFGLSIALLMIISLHLFRCLVGRYLHGRRQGFHANRRNSNEIRADDDHDAQYENEVINLHQFLLEASDFPQDDTRREWLSRRSNRQ